MIHCFGFFSSMFGTHQRLSLAPECLLSSFTRFQRFFLLPSVVLRIDHRIGSVPDESVISLLVAFDFQHIKGSPLLPPTSTNNGISHYYPALVASTAVFPLFITNFIDKIPPKRIANDTIRKYSEWEIYGRG